MKYGCYSEKQSELTGTVIYRTPEDKLVEVTQINDDPECASNQWPDKVLLGEVTEYVRRGSEPTQKIDRIEKRHSKEFLGSEWIEKRYPDILDENKIAAFYPGKPSPSIFDEDDVAALNNVLTELAEEKKRIQKKD